MKRLKIIGYVWWFVLIVIFVLFLIRLFLPSQIDDITPGISCSEYLVEWSDVLYVIPLYNGSNISQDKEWCDRIKGLEKETAMHGVYHTYEEFSVFRNEEYFSDGLDAYVSCFGEDPTRFKPPQLAWSKENDWIKDKYPVDLFWNQLFHKVYHCEDTGIFPNWVVRIF